jgi:hypothetical protein
MKFDKFEKKIGEITDIINDAIKLDHGILCNREGINKDAELKDKVLLHIADVIVMFVHQVKPHLGKPKFWFKTDGSETVDTSKLENPFVHSLNEEQKKFLFYNADYFIVVFSYWGNYSMLPCRMIVPEMLVNASTLHYNERFRMHQIGKLEQLNREQWRVLDKSHFMV